MHHSNIVVNLVGRFHETRNFKFREAIVDSAREIATVAQERGVERLVHFSAVGAAANAPSRFLRAAAAAEEVVRDAFPGATILRVAPVLGPDDNLLNHWGVILRGTGGRVLPLLEPPNSVFQPIVFKDVADAFQAVLENPKTASKTFELAGPDVWKLEDFIRKLVIPGTNNNSLVIKVPPSMAQYEEFCSIHHQGRLPRFPNTHEQSFGLQTDSSTGKQTWSRLRILLV